MKGSLRERSPGTWELIVQLPRDPETGLRKQLSRTHYGTKREAQRALAALVTKVSEGKITSTAKTLGELLDSWIDHVEGSLSPAITDVLRMLTLADADDPEYRALLRVLTATGARRGEVCGLRWSDLDTKTHASRRIALDDATLAVLDAQHEGIEDRSAACEVELDPHGYVFTESADGADPLHPDTITARFTRIRKRAGLDGVRLYDLRHLHATQLLAARVPVRTGSGRLGHANAATTLNVYAHFLEASDREAADVIGDILG